MAGCKIQIGKDVDRGTRGFHVNGGFQVKGRFTSPAFGEDLMGSPQMVMINCLIISEAPKDK